MSRPFNWFKQSPLFFWFFFSLGPPKICINLGRFATRRESGKDTRARSGHRRRHGGSTTTSTAVLKPSPSLFGPRVSAQSLRVWKNCLSHWKFFLKKKKKAIKWKIKKESAFHQEEWLLRKDGY
jgi:hypothetical protein